MNTLPLPLFFPFPLFFALPLPLSPSTFDPHPLPLPHSPFYRSLSHLPLRCTPLYPAPPHHAQPPATPNRRSVHLFAGRRSLGQAGGHEREAEGQILLLLLLLVEKRRKLFLFLGDSVRLPGGIHRRFTRRRSALGLPQARTPRKVGV